MTNDNDARGALSGSPKTDSHEFIVTTNREHEEWFRAMFVPECEIDLNSLWAWQEQERRKRAALASLPAGDGLATAADYIQSKADDYAREFGVDDLGSLSFGNEDMRIYHWHLVELADEIRALAAPRQPGGMGAGVPKGWKLVPVEPTEDMAKAYLNLSMKSWRQSYAAMLFAAPPAPQIKLGLDVRKQIEQVARFVTDGGSFSISISPKDARAMLAYEHSGYVESAASGQQDERKCTCGSGPGGGHSRTCKLFDESMMRYDPFGLVAQQDEREAD